jgi:hypothetical protein
MGGRLSKSLFLISLCVGDRNIDGGDQDVLIGLNVTVLLLLKITYKYGLVYKPNKIIYNNKRSG